VAASSAAWRWSLPRRGNTIAEACGLNTTSRIRADAKSCDRASVARPFRQHGDSGIIRRVGTRFTHFLQAGPPPRPERPRPRNWVRFAPQIPVLGPAGRKLALFGAVAPGCRPADSARGKLALFGAIALQPPAGRLGPLALFVILRPGIASLHRVESRIRNPPLRPPAPCAKRGTSHRFIPRTNHFPRVQSNAISACLTTIRRSLLPFYRAYLGFIHTRHHSARQAKKPAPGRRGRFTLHEKKPAKGAFASCPLRLNRRQYQQVEHRGWSCDEGISVRSGILSQAGKRQSMTGEGGVPRDIEISG